jgi:ornithine cyclodeaminase/alanine dehydrogenase-like protein (mu-crystallin family)
MGDGVPLPAALRPHTAPCRHWDEATVHRRLTADPAGYLAFARGYLADLAAGRARMQMPPKLVLDDGLDERGGGDFRLMPCVLRGPRGVLKTVKIIGTNRAQRLLPGQITVGELLVLDGAEQCVIERFDACLLSSARTGLVAALALTALAPQARRIAIVGAGRVGYYTAIYCAAALPLTRIELVDRDTARAADTAHSLRDAGLPCEAAPRADPTCDAWLLATTSEHAFCAPPPHAPPVVLSLGADAAGQRELTDAWAGRAARWVDSADAVNYGDLRAWRERGLIDGAAPPDLAALLMQSTPAAAGEPRLFISTGCALYDNLTAAYLLHGAG